MSKWYGTIGFVETVETVPGVWKETAIERNYFGDMNRNTRRLQSTEHLNDDVNINNELSIVADPYINEHFHSIRYVEFMGAKWKANSVQVSYPRLIIELGGLYNDTSK